jgi:hypothetical protein
LIPFCQRQSRSAFWFSTRARRFAPTGFPKTPIAALWCWFHGDPAAVLDLAEVAFLAAPHRWRCAYRSGVVLVKFPLLRLALMW